MTRTDFPRLTSRQGDAWGIGTAVAAVLLCAYLVLEDPSRGVWVLLLLLLMSPLVVAMFRHGQWIELDGPEPVLAQRRLLKTNRVGLRTARDVTVRGNGGGTAMLWATATDRTTAFAPVLALNLYVKRSQSAEVLEAAAGALEGSRAKGAPVAREQLLAQAAHVRRGGTPEESPLAGVTGDLTGIARGTGAAGGAAGLTDGL